MAEFRFSCHSLTNYLLTIVERPLLFAHSFQICIYGNSYESFLVAIANPNKEALESWARENGIAGDFNTICNNPQAKSFILGELTKIAKENKVYSLLSLNLKLEESCNRSTQDSENLIFIKAL